MAIRIVRFGTRKQRGEGVRLGTVRRPPRGVRKGNYAAGHWFDVWLPNLAPSAATSCVALQDMPEIPRVLEAISTVLRPNGRFVASITHPCTDTPFRAWERDANRRKRWLCIDRYFQRGPVRLTWTRWGDEFTTDAMHATLEDWFTWILEAGFHVRGVREPRPTEEALAHRPDLEDATRVPYYVFFDLVRAGEGRASIR